MVSQRTVGDDPEVVRLGEAVHQDAGEVLRVGHLVLVARDRDDEARRLDLHPFDHHRHDVLRYLVVP